MVKDTSPDDHLTEKKALAQAKKEGIEFVDTFQLSKLDTLSGEMLPETYTSAEVAETARKKRKDAKKYHVVQVRTRVA